MKGNTMKQLLIALKLFFVFTIITGVIYPLCITGIAQVVWPFAANGKILVRNNHACGSLLIGQQFTRPEYFWPRPSAVDYNPMPSGGSNLSLTSKHLHQQIEDRMKMFTASCPRMQGAAFPSDLLFASASGLDPHISPVAAYVQVHRIAAARGLSPDEKKQVRACIRAYTEQRGWNLFGEPRVNVLRLNMALDRITQHGSWEKTLNPKPETLNKPKIAKLKIQN